MSKSPNRMTTDEIVQSLKTTSEDLILQQALSTWNRALLVYINTMAETLEKRLKKIMFEKKVLEVENEKLKKEIK